MIHRSASLPSVRRPAPQSLARSQSFSGAIHGSPVQPSAPIDTAAPEQAIAVSAHPQQSVVVFDVGSLPPELQQLIFAAICNPHDTCTLAQLQEALKAFKVASGVNKSFYRGALPLLHATFLRLFGAGRINGASFGSLPLENLPQILEGIVARSGLSGLQCLSDLVNGSLGEHPNLAVKAFDHWMGLSGTAMATTALPYNALPTLIAVQLGRMLRRPGVPPTHVVSLIWQLVRMAAGDGVKPAIADPALIEVALLALAKEAATGQPFRAPPMSGRHTQWLMLTADHVLHALRERDALDDDTKSALVAVAQVLATRWPLSQRKTPPDAATVRTALAFVAAYPYPLIGCLSEALDIIQGLDLSGDPHIEGLLARCAAKRARARPLAVDSGSAPLSIQVNPLAGAQVLVNGVPASMEMLRKLGVVRFLDPSPQ